MPTHPSPILFQNLLILTFDGFDQQYVVALDKNSGDNDKKKDRQIDYGTDNGDDTPLETRVLRVRQALTKGQALIVFDPDSEQCQLMLKHDVPKHLFD